MCSAVLSHHYERAVELAWWRLTAITFVLLGAVFVLVNNNRHPFTLDAEAGRVGADIQFVFEITVEVGHRHATILRHFNHGGLVVAELGETLGSSLKDAQADFIAGLSHLGIHNGGTIAN